jgi:hypothetical protein
MNQEKNTLVKSQNNEIQLANGSKERSIFGYGIESSRATFQNCFAFFSACEPDAPRPQTSSNKF